MAKQRLEVSLDAETWNELRKTGEYMGRDAAWLAARVLREWLEMREDGLLAVVVPKEASADVRKQMQEAFDKHVTILATCPACKTQLRVEDLRSGPPPGDDTAYTCGPECEGCPVCGEDDDDGA